MTKLRWFYQGLILLFLGGIVFQIGVQPPPPVSAAAIYGAVWNHAETQLLTWSEDGTARIWDAETGAMLQRLSDDNTILYAAWNADDTQILTQSYRHIYTWDTQSGSQLHEFKLNDEVAGAQWNPDQTVVFGWTETNFAPVILWDSATGSEILRLNTSGETFAVEWSPDGHYIYTQNYAGHLQVWDGKTGEAVVNLQHEFAEIRWSADSTQLLLWHDGSADILEVQTGEFIFSAFPEDFPYVDGVEWNQALDQLIMWMEVGAAEVWDISEGKLAFVLTPYAAELRGVIRNPDNTQIVTWATGNVQIWEATTGTLIKTLYLSDSLSGVSISPTGTKLLTWIEGGKITVRDTSTWETLTSFEPQRDFYEVSWNQAETQLLVRAEYHLQILDMPSASVATKINHQQSIRGVSLSPDGNYLLTRAEDGNLRAWDTQTGESIFTDAYVQGTYTVTWGQDSKRFLIVDEEEEDNIIWLWDFATSASLVIEVPRFEKAYWNPAETQLLTWSGKNIDIWDTATGTHITTLTMPGEVSQANWTQDSSAILTWTETGDIYLWDVATTTPKLTINPGTSVGGIRFNQDETRLVTWSENQEAPGSRIQVWDMADGSLMVDFIQPSYVYKVTWSPDETALFTEDERGNLEFWDTQTGELLVRIDPRNYLNYALLNASGDRLLGWENNGVAVWDTHTGRQVLHLQNYREDIYGVQWSADGTQILSWTYHTPAEIWDAQTGKVLLILPPRSNVAGASWNTDQTRLMTIANGTTEIWDATTGQRLFGVRGRNARWSDDERYIITVADDAYLWDAETGELLQTFSHWGTP